MSIAYLTEVSCLNLAWQ